MPTQQQKNQHLLRRAGFGPAASQWDDVQRRSTAELWSALKKDSAAAPTYLNVLDEELLSTFRSPALLRGYDEAGRKRVAAKNRVALRDINLRWLREMSESRAQLREKMAFFWHGHFPTYTLNINNAQLLLHVLRTHALGNFRTLLTQVSQSAAMMLYLNAQQNRKGHPNENFAREVMELFTLGRGNYTEKDIQEAARAFTGWRVEADGSFGFKDSEHDGSSKTIFGKTGAWKGEDVLGFLLDRRETAVHLTRKLYKFLVSDTPSEPRVQQLADVFYKSGYEISALLDAIFTAPWFYETELLGARIKSPIELLAGIRRTIPLTLENEEYYLLLQRVLGQTLFYPPNVAGWPGGRTWIDSTTLPARMRLPGLLREVSAGAASGDGPVNVVNTVFSNAKPRPLGKGTVINTRIDWTAHLKRFDGVKREDLTAAISESLLAIPLQVPASLVTGSADAGTRESFLRTATLQVMALPEYQLC
ncbi:MAG: DUF1800 domain-containing protein [Chitinophagaceae bacterium]|nr:MAG: DUF1800 domain-containing protein [Chitinophagaceae bacterium]